MSWRGKQVACLTFSSLPPSLPPSPSPPSLPSISHSVGVGREGRPVRRGKNIVLEWLRDVYQRIFWFGLDGLEDDDGDYYLDEIDWLGTGTLCVC